MRSMGAKWAGIYSAEFREMVAVEYDAGEGLETVAARHGCSTWVVKQAVLRSGGKMRSPGPSFRTFSPEQISTILALYESGLSQQNIAGRMGMRQPVISRLLNAHGVSTGGQKGPRNPRWQGGRRVNGYGYIEVWIPEDSLFAAMRRSNGYTGEHRLLMAKSLGRPLERQEQVHHKNGIKDDNRIENLELRRGPHGAGGTLPHCPTCTCC